MSYQYPNVAGYSSMPTTPQTPYQWDGGDPQQLEQQVLQHPLQQQQQHQQPQDVYATSSSSTTMQFQEQVPIVPSQNPTPGHLEGDELHMQHLASASASGSMHPENMRPLIHVDTTRHVHAGASASPPSAGYHGQPGPVRSHVSPSHTDARMVAHPYRRPQSAVGTGATRPRRELEGTHSVRYSSRQPSGPSSSMPAPTRPHTNHSGTTSAACVSLYRSQVTHLLHSRSSLVSPAHAVSLLPSSGPRFIIRTDVHYNADTGVLTAMLELPGLKKNDLSIVLSTCHYNRVKQVVVTGRSRPVFSDSGYAVKERKFGEFTRTLVVSHETKPEDVYAEMQDGLLTIKIQLPPPPPPEEEEGSQEIAIH